MIFIGNAQKQDFVTLFLALAGTYAPAAEASLAMRYRVNKPEKMNECNEVFSHKKGKVFGVLLTISGTSN
jgi:hypothetical protein